MMDDDSGRLGADAPTALSSPTAMETACGLHPDGLQSAGASSAELFNGILRQHADAQVRVSELVTPMTYRGWEIRRGRWPEPDWMATHPNFDASWEGEEDGWVHNGLQADAPTYEALCEEIDSIEEDRGA